MGCGANACLIQMLCTKSIALRRFTRRSQAFKNMAFGESPALDNEDTSFTHTHFVQNFGRQWESDFCFCSHPRSFLMTCGLDKWPHLKHEKLWVANGFFPLCDRYWIILLQYRTHFFPQIRQRPVGFVLLNVTLPENLKNWFNKSKSRFGTRKYTGLFH